MIENELESYIVSINGEENAPVWEEYVNNHNDGTIFHSLIWQDLMQKVFGFKSWNLISKRNGDITGILPLMQVNSIFFGKLLISVPFGVYGGLLVNEETSAQALVRKSSDLAKQVNAKYVELRHLVSPLNSTSCNNNFYTFIEKVPDTEDGCLKRIPRKARAEVRKALKNPRLSSKVNQIGISEFYQLYSINKRKLGSPIFPKKLFQEILNVFNEDLVIVDIRIDDVPVSAVLSFIYKDTIMPYYSGANSDSEHFSIGNFMYYKLMLLACQRGLKYFDFGRSPINTGAFSFKKNQGFQPKQLVYDYILNTQKQIPEFTPSNSTYRNAQQIFKRMPLRLTQMVGNVVVKNIPF